ncbi:MAG: hypothetical protein HY663_06440 [Chloroflexi bacterium]|nr:hypothetical protein [Chloroflexota bacterium]
MFTNSRVFSDRPLGMNLRNHLIKRFNSLDTLLLAKDKTAFKLLLEANGIATPHTYHVIHDFTDMKLIPAFPDTFVIKPNSGYGGHGIILLSKEDGFFIDPSGEKYSVNEIKFHIRRILDGEFSGYVENDWAIVEERIYPSPNLQFGQSIGLPDIRIICTYYEPVMAMLRYPTLESRGRANLSRGALGMGIDLNTGSITHIYSKRAMEELSLESLGVPATFVMPKWSEMKEIARRCARLSQLGLCGVDIILDTDDTVMVLEINGRPGLEIQNVNEASLLRLVKSLMTERELLPAHGARANPGQKVGIEPP